MSEFITLTEARGMTRSYQQRRTALTEQTLPEHTLPICETFEKEQVLKLLSQPDCTGLRAYFGLDAEDRVKLVLVGVNSKDEDMYQGTDSLLDRAGRCPSVCPPDSPLNS